MSGNMEKHDSYTLAYDRIALALKQGFPLEAIAIEESIIADRLISYLTYKGKSVSIKTSFFELIDTAKNTSTDFKINIYSQLDSWRDKRNKMLHGIVKSMPKTAPEIKADDFIQTATELAEEGLKFTRIVQNWQRHQN